MLGFNSFHKWVEQYLFFPTPFQKLISMALLPLTLIYCIIIAIKRNQAKPAYFGIPVISIGNLIVGGSGKTPTTIAIAKYVQTIDSSKKIAIVLRGYGRKSKGLYVVSNDGKILEDIDVSGDEAMVFANTLANCTVIVSEDRREAILKAKTLGCDLVLLDDGFSKYNIAKFDIVLRPAIEPENIFCLPSGGYRETKMMYSFAKMVLKEDIDFKRVVTFEKDGQEVDILPKDVVILTAISKAERLLDFVTPNTPIISYEDHHYFTQEDIEFVKTQYPDFAILTTQKDFVKLKSFNLSNIYIMKLEVSINQQHLELIKTLIKP